MACACKCRTFILISPGIVSLANPSHRAAIYCSEMTLPCGPLTIAQIEQPLLDPPAAFFALGRSIGIADQLFGRTTAGRRDRWRNNRTESAAADSSTDPRISRPRNGSAAGFPRMHGRLNAARFLAAISHVTESNEPKTIPRFRFKGYYFRVPAKRSPNMHDGCKRLGQCGCDRPSYGYRK